MVKMYTVLNTVLTYITNVGCLQDTVIKIQYIYTTILQRTVNTLTIWLFYTMSTL
jgi:hypothetical protein